jgi:MoxR-like ATPase
MFMLKVGYPSAREELAIAKLTTSDAEVHVDKVLRGPEILNLQKMIRQVPISDHVAMYAVKLARATRPNEAGAPDFIREFVNWGVGPRAVQYLVLGAKARAALHGEYNVTTAHVKQVAPLILRHRVIPNFHAEAEGMDADKIIQRLAESVTEPTPAEYDELAKA